VKDFEKRLRFEGYSRIKENVIPVYKIEIKEDEIEDFTMWLFERALKSYNITANLLRIRLEELAISEEDKKTNALKRRAYRIYRRLFGRIIVQCTGSPPASISYLYGLEITDGHRTRNSVLYSSTTSQLIKIVLKAYRQGSVTIHYPWMTKKRKIKPRIFIYVPSKAIFKKEKLSVPAVIAGMLDGDGTVIVGKRRGKEVHICYGKKKRQIILNIIKKLKVKGKERKDSKSYRFVIKDYKLLSKTISFMLHEERKKRLNILLKYKNKNKKKGNTKKKIKEEKLKTYLKKSKNTKKGIKKNRNKKVQKNNSVFNPIIRIRKKKLVITFYGKKKGKAEQIIAYFR